MHCPKCRTAEFLQIIYKDNCHTENYSQELNYYQCTKCKGYIKFTKVLNTEWSENSFLSKTLA